MQSKLINEIAFVAVVVCWFVFALGFVFRRKSPEQTERKRETMAAIGIILKAIGYALVWSVRRQFATALLPLGLILETVVAALATIVAVASVWLTLSAITTLGKQWSPVARIIEQHRLITSGPYRIVRHPIYAGMFGLLIATGLTTSEPWALLLAVIAYVLGSSIRIRVEERLLIEHFGTDYIEYKRKVPALIPYLV